MAITGFPFLPDNLLSALSETLLSSIWQGLALAATATLILISTRRTAPALRYNLLLGTLVAFTCVSVYTFVHALEPSPAEVLTQSSLEKTAVQQAGSAPAMILPVTAAYGDWKHGLLTFMQNHSREVVAIWLAIVFIRCMQLLAGIQGLYDLRRQQVFDVPAHWVSRVARISYTMGIKKAVKLAESGLATVPVMIGYLKPIILLPVGILSALRPEEIEAILIHELAHIRRRDYLINFLQHLLEILFFFNPAVLWVSAQIRKERENCCDDIVLAQTGNQISYIKALVACQEYQPQPGLAMAIQGQKGSLLGRVNRMISGKNPSLNLAERCVLALCLMLSCIFLAGFSTPQAPQTATEKVVKLQKPSQEPVPPAPKTPRQKAAVSKPKAVRSPKPAVVSTTLKTNTTVRTNVNTNINMDTQVAPVPPVSPVPAVKPGTVAKPAKAANSRQADLSDRVLADMVKDGLIHSPATQVSFKLTNTSFEVNGKAQPEAVFQRYRRKYVPVTKAGSQWSLYHNHNQNSNTTTTTVQKP